MERFGIPPHALDRFTFLERGGTVHALSVSRDHMHSLLGLRVVTVGVPLVRRIGKHHLKLTSPALRLLSPSITRNRIRLDDAEALRLMARGEIPWAEPASEGYVLLETTSGVLGCGLMLPGRLRSQIPRSEAQALTPRIS
jgi:NOL1/NOP2/fmu family ribosome biogenesis protein